MKANGPYGYARSHRILEVVGIASFLAAIVFLTVRLVLLADDAGDATALAVALLTGYVLADFISGVVHWAGDTIGDENLPFIGKHFVRPFRMHHVDPKEISRHDFIETNGNNCLVSLPVLLGAWFLIPETAGVLYFSCGVVVFSQWFIFCTNQFHKWSHSDTPPSIARVLQRLRIILPPDHHDVHHAIPHDKYYCITAGWMNPLLTKIRFFRAAEAVLTMINPALLALDERKQFAALTAVAANGGSGGGATAGGGASASDRSAGPPSLPS